MAVANPLLSRRFEELTQQLAAIAAAKRIELGGLGSGEWVDGDALLGWTVKARSLISNACGAGSEHYVSFVEAEKPRPYGTNYGILKSARAVFLAAREDYEGGYLASIRTLVHAEVFDDELEQAAALLNSGYVSAAAVVAGTVLETSLRHLCQARSLPIGNLNALNAALAKDGCYHLLVQKRITALADIRNNAAHGHSDRFSEADVRDMIAKVSDFLVDHL